MAKETKREDFYEKQLNLDSDICNFGKKLSWKLFIVTLLMTSPIAQATASNFAECHTEETMYFAGCGFTFACSDSKDKEFVTRQDGGNSYRLFFDEETIALEIDGHRQGILDHSFKSDEAGVVIDVSERGVAGTEYGKHCFRNFSMWLNDEQSSFYYADGCGRFMRVETGVCKQ